MARSPSWLGSSVCEVRSAAVGRPPLPHAVLWSAGVVLWQRDGAGGAGVRGPRPDRLGERPGPRPGRPRPAADRVAPPGRRVGGPPAATPPPDGVLPRGGLHPDRGGDPAD